MHEALVEGEDTNEVHLSTPPTRIARPSSLSPFEFSLCFSCPFSSRIFLVSLLCSIEIKENTSDPKRNPSRYLSCDNHPLFEGPHHFPVDIRSFYNKLLAVEGNIS